MTSTAFPSIAPPDSRGYAKPVVAPWGARRGADRPWDLLIVALAVYIVMAVGRAHQLFPLLNVVKPLLLASLVAAGAYLFAPGGGPLRRPLTLRHSVPLRCMAGVLLWGLLSIPGALWVGNSFDTVVNGLLKAVLMAAVIAGAVRSVRDVERLAAAYAGSVALYALVILARFHVDADNWRLASLYYYDANDFATVAVTALPLGLYFLLRGRNLLVRAAAAAGLAITMSAWVWCGSRGGFLAAIVVGLYVIIAYSTIPFRWRLLGTALVVLVVSMTASDAFWEKMRTILHPKDDYNLESNEGRKAIWTRGIGYMLGHPIFGVGAGDFPVAEGTISPQAERQALGRGVKWQAAHNSYVQVGAELGFPGLLWFIAMLGTSLVALLGRRRRPRDALTPSDPRGRPLGQALAAAIIGYAAGAVFLSLAYADAPYVLVALAAGLTRIPTW